MLSNRVYAKMGKHKLLLVIVWGMFLGMDTWTDNLGAFLRFQSLHFRWIASPDFLSFFNFNDLTKFHHFFIIVKIGHFIGFGVFDFLLYHWLNNHKKAIGFSVVFALLTEILQLFFGRDGRLYDLIIDSLGVITVYFIVKNNLNEALYKKFLSH